jgi:hypothetical protein
MTKEKTELIEKLSKTDIPVELKQDLLKTITLDDTNDSYASRVNELKERGWIIAKKNKNAKARLFNYKTGESLDWIDARKMFNTNFLIKMRNTPDNELYTEYMRPDKEVGGFIDENGIKCWNTFTGWNIKPVKKEWKHIEDYLFRVLCRKDETNYNYLLKWLSKIISHPESKTGVSLALTGEQGSGKTTLYKILRNIMGTKYCYTTNKPQDIKKEFNGYLYNCLLCLYDEASFDKADYHKVKQWITEDTISIEFKGQDQDDTRNFTTFMLATNERKFLPIENNDRRWFILESSNEEAKAERVMEYWTPFWKTHLKNEIEGFVDYLYSLDIETLERPPITEAKRQQQELAQSEIISWWYDYINTNECKERTEKKEKGFVLKCRTALERYNEETIFKTNDKTFINEIKSIGVNTIKIQNANYFIMDSINKNNNTESICEGVSECEGKIYSFENDDKKYTMENTLTYPNTLTVDNDNSFESQIEDMLDDTGIMPFCISYEETADSFTEYRGI